jgi:hypothetical protein
MGPSEDRLTEESGTRSQRKAAGPNRRSQPKAAAQARTRVHSTDREEDQREALDNRDRSEDAIFADFMDSFDESALPDLPIMPGYHLFWATTMNQHDSPARRARMGYTPIRVDELPGWEGSSAKAGEYAGCVVVNEMVAMKIPISLYNRYMKKLHHDMPLEEDQKLTSTIDMLREEAEAKGSRIVEVGDGTASIVQGARPMQEFQY